MALDLRAGVKMLGITKPCLLGLRFLSPLLPPSELYTSASLNIPSFLFIFKSRQTHLLGMRFSGMSANRR